MNPTFAEIQKQLAEVGRRELMRRVYNRRQAARNRAVLKAVWLNRDETAEVFRANVLKAAEGIDYPDGVLDGELLAGIR